MRECSIVNRNVSDLPNINYTFTYFKFPVPYAKKIGSLLLKPSMNPGKGDFKHDSMMDGRTIIVGQPPLILVTINSPRAFV